MTFGERFLALPDLFPARRSGEPWGERDLLLDLPGGPFVLDGLSPAQADRLGARWEDFRTPDRSGGVRLALLRANPSDFLEVSFRETGVTFDVDPGPTSVRIAGRRFMALLDREPLAAALFLADEASEFLAGDVENVLRVVAAHRLLATGGALFHSAGIVDGRAHLFFGHSGAGKSTLSALSEAEGRVVLSDELNALVRDESGARLERLPFAGDFGFRPGGRRSYPLRAVWCLEKGPTTEVAPVPRAEIAARMAACAPYANGDPWLGETLLANLNRLLSDVPSYRLTFPKSGPVWDVVSRKVPS